jgi:RecJ-like exonuclease
MQESNLIKAALITSLAGILLLSLIVEKVDLSASNIASLSNTSLDSKVKIKGEVISYKNIPSVKIIQVKDLTSQIKVIAFTDKDLELKKQDIIEVTGILKIYQDRLEIEAEEIKIF